MKRFFINTQDFNNNLITGDEFNHMKNVMRMNKGDEFIAFIDDENDYYCSITSIEKTFIKFKVDNHKTNNNNPKINITIFQALAKGEKMELIAQKLTEIGVSTIYPLFVKNCDVKQNTNKPERLRKIVINACKQCGRSKLTRVEDVIALKELIEVLDKFDLVLFANETEKETRIYDILNKNKKSKSVAFIIGPEGGFTQEEINTIKEKATSVSFGNRILRTETAAIYLASIINDFYGN